jgi:hypothetical protein
MERKARQADLTRFLITNSVAGAVTGILWGALILATDTAGLGELVRNSSSPAENVMIFLAGSAVTLLPFAVAISIGSLAFEGDGSSRSSRR